MRKPRVFYGYWILAACFIFCIISAGCSMVSFSLFVTPLQTDLGWSRTAIMAAFTILVLFTGLTAPFAGRLVDRYGAKSVIPLGALVAAIGFVLLSQMSNLWHYYVGYAVIGVGLTAVGQVTSSCVVSHWFVKRRGLAIGIMSMGLGLSGVIFAPLVAVYLIPNFGWSNAYLALAVITGGLVIPLALSVIRTKPAELGLFPDGMETADLADTAEANTSASHGLPLKVAMATSAFWLISASVMFNHTHLGVVQNAFPHLTDMGFPLGISASAIGIGSIMSAVSVFFFGWLCDRTSAKFACTIGLSLTALGILIFIYIDADSPAVMVWLYSFIVGFGIGSWMPTMSMLVSKSFGMAHYGSIFGMASLFQHIGAAAGPLLAGYLYDSMNSYHRAFIIILALVVLAIPLVMAVRRPASYQPTEP